MNRTEPLPGHQGTLGSAKEPNHRGVVGYVVGHFLGSLKGPFGYPGVENIYILPLKIVTAEPQ